MDGGKTITVELSERELRALLLALCVSGGYFRRDPALWESVVRAGAEKLAPGCFAGSRQWHADELVAGLRLWRAAGFSGEPPEVA